MILLHLVVLSLPLAGRGDDTLDDLTTEPDAPDNMTLLEEPDLQAILDDARSDAGTPDSDNANNTDGDDRPVYTPPDVDWDNIPTTPIEQRPKKVFAHYMGCWPAGGGPTWFNRHNGAVGLKHGGSGANARGGHIRNWPLTPDDRFDLEAACDLEIRRAMRIGIDGFAVDAWAGMDDARRTLDALFKVAQEKDYDFELTVCIDPVTGGHPVGTVRELLAKHGDSPKLARRDGKPLVFGYQSHWPAIGPAKKRGDPVDRVSPESWNAIGRSYREFERAVGEPIFYHYCLSWLFLNTDKEKRPDDAEVLAAGEIAKHVGAVGAFGRMWKREHTAARVVRAAGAEWSNPVGMYQKENIPYEVYMGPGTDWMVDCWRNARATDSTLLQIITWNDYGENTNIAPAYNTRYTLYDLTGYHIRWWKLGKPPAIERDRVYLIYRKYPKGAKVYPFQQGPYRDGALEVTTLLTEPATIRLPGRDIEYHADAGYVVKQFKVTAGPVIAEVVRDGKVVMKLESPEPITDRPFREDNGMVCYSSEYERLWREDFGNDIKPYYYSEYGDLDNDGLPNWFEMYWFSKERDFQPVASNRMDALFEEVTDAPANEVRHSKWLDFSTATYADPKADVDADGKTNLEEYLARTDPTMGKLPQSPGLDVDAELTATPDLLIDD